MYNFFKDREYQIKYLKEYGFNPFDSRYHNVNIKTIHIDIITYITEMENILMKDLFQDNISYPANLSLAIKNRTLQRWFTNNGKIVTNCKETFILWIDLSYRLLNIYDELKVAESTSTTRYNMMRLQSYILNIPMILNEIYHITTE